ncbi:MAG: LysM peptidoglycan-binding domain-containing protein [Verrucomicrobia bacterium]|nr:LysM peptidoglycan-binding domain-containing protein [Verrucomicrobiota bacterium]
MQPFVQSLRQLFFLGLCLGALAGCDRLEKLGWKDDSKKHLKAGAERLAAGDLRGAVAEYERAVDGTPRTAEAHFRLGLIYHDQLKDPIGAVHHFRRYLEIDQTGQFSREARSNIARAEVTLATSLTGGTLINRQEAARIRNENLSLKQQLAVAKSTASVPRGKKTNAPPDAPPTAEELATGAGPKPAPGSPEAKAAAAAAKAAEREGAAQSRTYKVQPGDTLAGISKRFYQSTQRVNDLLDANHNALQGEPTNLRAGMILIIP